MKKTGEISFAIPDFGVSEKETMIGLRPRRNLRRPERRGPQRLHGGDGPLRPPGHGHEVLRRTL